MLDGIYSDAFAIATTFRTFTTMLYIDDFFPAPRHSLTCLCFRLVYIHFLEADKWIDQD